MIPQVFRTPSQRARVSKAHNKKLDQIIQAAVSISQFLRLSPGTLPYAGPATFKLEMA
jgi:hypothetical protein